MSKGCQPGGSTTSSVQVADLRQFAKNLLQRLEDAHGASIELDHDIFWSFPFTSLFDVSDSLRDLTIGQLSETVENPASIDDAVIDHGLAWLRDLLRAIGGQMGSDPGSIIASGTHCPPSGLAVLSRQRELETPTAK